MQIPEALHSLQKQWHMERPGDSCGSRDSKVLWICAGGEDTLCPFVCLYPKVSGDPRDVAVGEDPIGTEVLFSMEEEGCGYGKAFVTSRSLRDSPSIPW